MGETWTMASALGWTLKPYADRAAVADLRIADVGREAASPGLLYGERRGYREVSEALARISARLIPWKCLARQLW